MNISGAGIGTRSLAFLAPAGVPARDGFQKTSHNYSLYESLKAGMQRLRGRLYVQDGAISRSDLSADGRHTLPTDEQGWHLLTLGASGEVLGCTRYLQHSRGTHFDDLRVSEGPLAESDQWGAKLRAAVEEELRTAHASDFSYVEVGGWAMSEEIRCTAECLRSVLATYAWSRLIGGVIGLSTATERNGSASILRRLGGRSLDWNGEEIPSYFDPRYDCRMHTLRYDSRLPNSRYEEPIEAIKASLSNIPVISPERPMWQTLFRGFTAMQETAPRLVGDMIQQAA